MACQKNLPLIIAEEENGQSSDAIDRDEKLALRIAVRDIVFGDSVHGVYRIAIAIASLI